MKRFATILFSLSLLSFAHASPLSSSPAKKIIHFGWDNPTPSYLADNLEMIETFLPYDGTGINMERIVTLPDGSKFNTGYMFFSNIPFQRTWYQEDLDRIKTLKPNHLKYNFVMTVCTSYSKAFDIFNDDFWEATCQNYAIMAWFAKEAGFKGIGLDLEDYGGAHQWAYRANSGKSYDESWTMARQRGRQWMNAIAKEYPDVTLFCFFWLDLVMGYADGSDNLYQRLQASPNALLVAFINGIFDVLPPHAVIVDGMENDGYANKSIESLYKLRARRETRFHQFIAPENLSKFKLQSSLAVATYMTCYYNTQPPYSFTQLMKIENMTQIEFFRRNFANAVNFSDEYSWTWNESRKWFPCTYSHGWMNKSLLLPEGVPGPYMGMAIPGVEEVFQYVRDPDGYVRKVMKDPSMLRNLVRNPGFEDSTGQTELPASLSPDAVLHENLPHWETWKQSNSKGQFILGPGQGRNGENALRVSVQGNGVAHQAIRITPSGLYVVRAYAKILGMATANLGVQWRNDKGQWCNNLEIRATSFSEDLGDGWKRATLLIRNIPEGSIYMSPMLSVSGKSEGDIVCFDDIEVFSLFPETVTVAPHLAKYQHDYEAKLQGDKLDASAKQSPPVAGNLFPKGDFNYRSDNASQLVPLPAGFIAKSLELETYIDRKKHTGEFYRVLGKDAGYADDTAALAKKVTRGQILFHSPDSLKSGSQYVISARSKVVGGGSSHLSVYWLSPSSKGPFDLSKGTLTFAFSKDEGNGWKSMCETITLPDATHGFTILLNASGMKNDADEVWFDDLTAVKVK